MHEVVPLPQNVAQVMALAGPEKDKLIVQLMDERSITLDSERAHRIAIAGLVSRYGHGVLGADGKMHAISLPIREKDIRSLPGVFDVKYEQEPGALRCVITSPEAMAQGDREDEATQPSKLVLVK